MQKQCLEFVSRTITISELLVLVIVYLGCIAKRSF